MADDKEQVLSAFPKERPPLSAAQREIAQAAINMNRYGENSAAGMAKKLERWMHRKVASRAGGAILEVGAGILNHVSYENGYTRYDIVEPNSELYLTSNNLDAVDKKWNDIAEIGIDEKYDRVISVAVLEHLTDLPACVAKSAVLLKNNGVFQAGIPSEGAFLWGAAWRSTTGIMFRKKFGLSYKERMRHEHINTAAEILAVIGHFFGKVEVARFPTPLFHLSFYHYIEASEPDTDRCRGYLKGRESKGRP